MIRETTGNPAATAQQSQVSLQIARLEMAIESLTKTINTLEQPLACVLRPQIETGPKAEAGRSLEPPQALVPLASALATNVDRMESLVRRVGDLCVRLEV